MNVSTEVKQTIFDEIIAPSSQDLKNLAAKNQKVSKSLRRRGKEINISLQGADAHKQGVKRPLRTAAVFAAAVALAVAAVSAYRPEKQDDFSITETPTHIEVNLNSSASVEYQGQNINIPTYIPDGYELTETYDIEAIKYYRYENSKTGDSIEFSACAVPFSVNIDNETREYAIEEINSIRVLISKSTIDNGVILVWEDGGTAYYICSSNASPESGYDDTIKMAVSAFNTSRDQSSTTQNR